MSKKEKIHDGIGDVLQRLRKGKKITQEELAERLEISLNAIKQYESNKREPKCEYLIRICNFFNVTPTFLKKQYHISLDDLEDKYYSNIKCAHKTISLKKTSNEIKYTKILNEFVEKSCDNKNLLISLDILNDVNKSIRKIIVSKRKQYFCYNKNIEEINGEIKENICYNDMYFENDKINGKKKIRNKPLTELEAFILAEKEFNIIINEIEKDLKKIFTSKFKDEYITYKNNFKKKVENISNKIQL